jgi:hypothetical protein
VKLEDAVNEISRSSGRGHDKLPPVDAANVLDDGNDVPGLADAEVAQGGVTLGVVEAVHWRTRSGNTDGEKEEDECTVRALVGGSERDSEERQSGVVVVVAR